METEAMETIVPETKAGRIGLLITIGLLIVGAAIVMASCAYMVVRIDPSVPTFGVESASFNSPNITSCRLVAELDIVFKVMNHNDWHKAYLNTVSISLNSNMSNQSASTYLEPFSLKKLGTVYKEAQFNIDIPFSNGTVDFEIVLSTNVKLKSIIKSKDKSLKVVCNPPSMSLNPGSSNRVFVHGFTCNML